MPVFDDILDNKVLGREYKRGLEEGRQAMISLIQTLAQDRFGAVQPTLESKLRVMTLPELLAFARRIAEDADQKDANI